MYGLAEGGGGGGGDVKGLSNSDPLFTQIPQNLLNLNLDMYLWQSGERTVNVYYLVFFISTAFSLGCETFCILQTIILIFSYRG